MGDIDALAGSSWHKKTHFGACSCNSALLKISHRSMARYADEIERSKLLRERARQLRRQAVEICARSRQIVDSVISNTNASGEMEIRETPAITPSSSSQFNR